MHLLVILTHDLIFIQASGKILLADAELENFVQHPEGKRKARILFQGPWGDWNHFSALPEVSHVTACQFLILSDQEAQIYF